MFNLFISKKSLRNIIASANKRGHDDALETLVPALLIAAFERDRLELHVGLLEAHCLDLEALASDLEEKLVAAKAWGKLLTNSAYAAQVGSGVPNPSPAVDYCVMMRCETAGVGDWVNITTDVSLQGAVNVITRDVRGKKCQGCEYKIEAH